MFVQLVLGQTYVHPDGKIYKRFADERKSKVNFYDVSEAYGKILLAVRSDGGVKFFRTYVPKAVTGNGAAVAAVVPAAAAPAEAAMRAPQGVVSLGGIGVVGAAKVAGTSGKIKKTFGQRKHHVDADAAGEIDTAAALLTPADPEDATGDLDDPQPGDEGFEESDPEADADADALQI